MNAALQRNTGTIGTGRASMTTAVTHLVSDAYIQLCSPERVITKLLPSADDRSPPLHKGINRMYQCFESQR